MKFKLLAGLIQPVLLIAMTVWGLAPHFWGKEVVVKTGLYDPRDLFRGNYVRLDYDFNHIPEQEDETRPYEEFDRKIYATLKQGEDQIYHLDKMEFQRPESGIFLAGKKGKWSNPEFGVEAYFMPKDKALMLEGMMREISEPSLQERAKEAARKAQQISQARGDEEISMIQEEGQEETQESKIRQKYTAYARLKILDGGIARIDRLILVDNKTGEKFEY